MQFKYLNGIRNEVNAFYRANVIQWLTQHVKSGKINDFPKRFYLGAPTEDEDVSRNRDEFIKFCESWKQELTIGHVDFIKKNYPDIGEIMVPIHLVFDRPDDLAKLAGHLVAYHSALARLNVIRQELPQLVDSAIDNIKTLITFDELDFQRFVKVCKWLCANPRSGRLIRQIPVRGISNAWFERFRNTLFLFIGPFFELDPMRRDLSQLGLVPPSPMVRLVLLDRTLRQKVGGIRHLAVTTDDLPQLDLRPSRVLFFQDVSTAISIPDLDNTAIAVLTPHTISAVCKVPWVGNARCQFVGDIDLRSFAMLNNVRVYLPRTESLLMDIDTLLGNKDLWGYDDIPPQDAEMPMTLTAEEFNLYRMLIGGNFGRGVHLSQDRLPLDTIFEAIGARNSEPMPLPPPQMPRPLSADSKPAAEEAPNGGETPLS